ncbi:MULTISPECIES: thermonuclease family protein [Bacillus]|nr:MULTISPECIES: thermonuclease family protein [Bacillus]
MYKKMLNVFLLTGIVASITACSNDSNVATVQEQKVKGKIENPVTSKFDASSAIPSNYKKKIEMNGLESVRGKVKKVSDGDTYVVVVDKDSLSKTKVIDEKERQIKIRALLLDTPESVKPNYPVQAYGKEASKFAKSLLEGKDVEIVFDKGEKKDHYGRYLAYVFCDGKLIQEEIIKEGFGIISYVKKPNTTFFDELQKVELQAKSKKNGVWSIPDYVDENKHKLNRKDAAA